MGNQAQLTAKPSEYACALLDFCWIYGVLIFKETIAYQKYDGV